MTEGNMRKSDGKKCNSVTTCRSPTATSEVEAQRGAGDLSVCRVRKIQVIETCMRRHCTKVRRRIGGTR